MSSLHNYSTALLVDSTVVNHQIGCDIEAPLQRYVAWARNPEFVGAADRGFGWYGALSTASEARNLAQEVLAEKFGVPAELLVAEYIGGRVWELVLCTWGGNLRTVVGKIEGIDLSPKPDQHAVDFMTFMAGGHPAIVD